MDARTVRTLEFPKVLVLLAAQAATSLGHECCLRLRPRSEAVWVRARLAETTQARALLAAPALGSPPWGGITDQREALRRAQAGSVLLPTDLLAVADLAAGGRRLLAYFTRAQEDFPDNHVVSLGRYLLTYPDLEEAIARCLTPEGEISPEASPELARLLRHRVTLRERLRERMEALAQQYFQRGLLQDPLVVERGGRLSLPVLSQHHSRFPGLVHDRSGTGVTIFMEPLEVVPQGNELRETELMIEQEQERLLAELTARVGSHGADLLADLRRLTALDVIFAKARLSQVQDAVEPAPADLVDLRQARHPLLGAQAVPIDFELGESFRTLVVTGPNTGGKTVALKTVGLLALMAQAGLHVPANPGGRLPIFRHVFADIGDEQSLEQSLSTFSSHLTQIIKILHQVEAAARRGEGPLLVLLDELGAGTDPAEGTALAQALLETLHEAGCLTAITTHYNELKAYAYGREGMENAAVEFDVRTLQPTYRLLLGQPGSSNALTIAQRLGLPKRIVAAARQRMGHAGRDFARALERVERAQQELTALRREAQVAERESTALREQHARELEEFQGRRREAMQSGFAEAQEILRQAQEQAARIITSLQGKQRHDAEAERLRQELAQQREVLQAREEALRQEMRQAQEAVAPPSAPQPLSAVEPGQRVWAATWEREGTVLEVLGPDRVLVRVGAFQAETPLADLYPAPQERPASRVDLLALRKQLTVPPEIRLLGHTVDEARAELDRYLDDAALAGLGEVRIVHGKGTGALRQGLHAYLREHPVVASFALAPDSEGGSGVTVARLK